MTLPSLFLSESPVLLGFATGLPAVLYAPFLSEAKERGKKIYWRYFYGKRTKVRLYKM